MTKSTADEMNKDGKSSYASVNGGRSSVTMLGEISVATSRHSPL
jgi:hypothetical protein